MKDNIIKKIKEKESCLKGDDIERTLSSIASRFHIDLDHITNASATVSASTRRVSAGTVTPKKRDIGYTGADESSDYGLLHLINKGSTSNIYLAEQISLKRKVALKIMSKDVPLQNEAIQQFFREAQITSSLSHPNIIPVHDAGIVPDGSPFYAMKSMQGLSWNSLLHPGNAELEKQAQKYGLNEHLEILESVCNAVAFAHSHNVIHRDLKPANIVIGEFGEVIVMNWGLTVSMGSDDNNRGLTEENIFGGTIAYMAPEMARADGANIGKQSDVYLLGAILYEILTGFPPHEAETPRGALISAMQNKIRLPGEKHTIDMELMEIALKAMETIPSSRHTSVLEFQKELRNYRAHEESRSITENTKQLIERAKKQNEQIKSLRAVVLLEEALQLWENNDEAKELLYEAEKVSRQFSREFNSRLLKLIIRGDIYKIILRLITIPAYLLLFLLPFFLYLVLLFSTPLYEVGKIKVRQFREDEKSRKAVASEHFIFETYLLFDGEDIYHIEFLHGHMRTSRLSSARLIGSEEDEYYLEDRRWIIKRSFFQIFIAEQSLETHATAPPHLRVLDPFMLIKVKKLLNDFKKE